MFLPVQMAEAHFNIPGGITLDGGLIDHYQNAYPASVPFHVTANGGTFQSGGGASTVKGDVSVASGATLSIGAGNTLRQPVLNVGGTLAGGNLVVTERMNVTIGEKMNVTDGATLDLTGAELVVTNPEALQKGYTFATAPSGGIVPAAPRPLSGDLREYRLFLSRTKARIGKPGFTFIVR
jgi:hypothetical protein